MASYSRPVTYHHYSLLFIKHFCWKTKRTVRLYFTKIYSQSKSSRKRRKNEFERKKLKLAEKSWAHHVLSQQLGKKELFCPANMELATKKFTWTLSLVFQDVPLASGNARLETPLPVQTLKLNNFGLGQYLIGRRVYISWCCWLGFGYWCCLETSCKFWSALTTGGSFTCIISKVITYAAEIKKYFIRTEKFKCD